MPPAVALAAPAIAGGAASASGGKKGQKKAQAAADRQFQMQQQLLQTGLSAWQPAADYYSKLLSGDPTKIAEAVGPTSDILKGQAQAQARQTAATMPMGGEANAAGAAIGQNSYNQLARLYAGVQPGAASALGQLAALPMGMSAPNIGSGLGYNALQQQQQNSAKGQLGTGIGQAGAGAKHAKHNQPAGGGGSKASIQA